MKSKYVGIGKHLLIIGSVIVMQSIAWGQCLTINGNLNLTTNWSSCPNITELGNNETAYGGPNGGNLVAEVDLDASLCQTITGLSPGTQYVLSFDYTRRQSAGTPASVPLEITAPGAAGITSLNVTNTSWSWQTFTLLFTPTTASGNLSIVTNAAYSSTLGAIIDNVCISVANGPGGVLDHRLWFKANAGTSTTINNAAVNSWTSQTISPALTVTEGTVANQPLFRDGSGAAAPITASTNVFNYNPYIFFDGSNDKLQAGGTFDFGNSGVGMSNFNVFKPDNTNGIVYFEWNGPSATIKNKSDGFHVLTDGAGNTGTNNQFIAPNNVLPKIVHMVGLSSGLINIAGANGFCGVNHIINPVQSSNNNPSGVTDRVSLGCNVNAGEFARVSTTEIIAMNRIVTLTEQLRINTYLAVKYGITLGGNGSATNYLRSDGTIIWNGPSAYHNNVIGIGRDDLSALIQKQSHQSDDTVRLYLSNLTTTNVLNTGSFAANGSFIVLGGNTGKLCATGASLAEMPTGLTNCTLYSRLEREWRLQRVSSSETFSVDVKLNACAVPGSMNTAHLRLLVDDDGNFANGGTQCYYNGDGTGIAFTFTNPTVTISGLSTTHFPNNAARFFTIASVNELTPLPVQLLYFDGNLSENNQVTLKWASDLELHVDRYVIHRSADMTEWVYINEQPAFNSSHTYEMLDMAPLRGINYYRLSVYNNDQQKIEEAYVAVETKSTETFDIFPNPAHQAFFLMSKDQLVDHYEITDLNGKVWFSETLPQASKSLYISTADLANGMYFLRLPELGQYFRFEVLH